MTHLGDITKIDWFHVPPVDVVTGGSPCQDLSVAGKRAGLAGERSGLYMEQIRCVKELRQADEQRGRTGIAIRPRYMVWENVPGAFSSNGGEDFAAVLEEAVKVVCPESPPVPVPEGGWPTSGCLTDGVAGRWSVAWRVHDAQFWGVAQRRRRISVVCDFGGLSAPEVLFERKGLSGDFEPGGTPREETAGAAGGGVASTITATYGTKWNGNAGAYSGGNFVIEPAGGGTEGASGAFNPWDSQSARVYSQDGVWHSLNANENGGQSRDSVLAIPINTMVATKTAPETRTTFGVGEDGDPQFTLQAAHSHAVCAGFSFGQSEKSSSVGYQEERSPTLRSGEGGNQKPCVYDARGKGWREDVCYTLNTIDRPAVMAFAQNQVGEVRVSSMSGTLNTNSNASGRNSPLVYDARGNGNGQTVHTMTGDHRNRVTDYTALCIGNGQLNQVSMAEQANTPDTMHDQQAVMISAVDCRNLNEHQEVSGTFQSKENGGYYLNYQNPARTPSVVRRLTPLECERLQGYPDGWTDIGEWVDSKGKRHKDADSPRYKALGNSIALPFWFWLLRRISAQYIGPATLGSLFDGISGFCYVWARCNGSKSCLWVSEIEEFPIAVCKRHFGDEESGEVGDILEYL